MADNKKTKPGVNIKSGNLTEQGLVIQNINIRPVQRTMLAIDKWRQAHKQSDSINGTRIALYDMYDDAMLDGFLRRLVAKRVLGVTKNKLKYIDRTGKEVEGADALLKMQQFRKLRKRIQLQKAWGISVIEMMNEGGKLKVFDAPKKHIEPKEGKILYDQGGTDGIPYRETPYNRTVVQIGEYDDIGYLIVACAYVIYKRGGIGDWANRVQIFGMPFREARYDGFNEQVRIQLEQALESAASAAWIVLPEDAKLTLHETKDSAGSAELYDRLRTAMNEEMMVAVLGATETTTSSDSSGYAQSQTHQKTTDEVAQDDKEDELGILNEQVLPVLVNLGLLPEGGSFVYDEPIDLNTAKIKVEIAIKLKTEGKLPISDDYLYEISGIPKPDNYDELKAKIETVDEPVNNPDGPPKNGKKKLSIVDELKNWFTDFFAQAH